MCALPSVCRLLAQTILCTVQKTVSRRALVFPPRGLLEKPLSTLTKMGKRVHVLDL